MRNKNTERIIYISLGILILGAVLVVSVLPARTSGKLDCELDGIQLVNVNPYECWNNKFSPEFCPVPSKVRCSAEGEFPVSMGDVLAIGGDV